MRVGLAGLSWLRRLANACRRPYRRAHATAWLRLLCPQCSVHARAIAVGICAGLFPRRVGVRAGMSTHQRAYVYIRVGVRTDVRSVCGRAGVRV